MVSNLFFMDRSQESQLQTQILEQISDAVIATDIHHCVIYCNRTALNQYKLEECEILGKPLQECFTYSWEKPEDEHLAWDALETQGYWQGENIHCLLDGTKIFVESRVTILRDGNGNSIGLLATIRDISDRQGLETKLKQTVLALQKSENRYRQMVQTQVDFLLQSLPDKTITFANDSLCRALGCTLEQLIGQKWIDFIIPDDLHSTLQKIALLNPLNSTFVAENRDLRAGGQIGWTQWINQGIFNELGQLTLIQSTGRDITELKNAEAALKVSEANSKTILSAIPDLIFRISKNGLIYRDFYSRGIVGSIIHDDVEIIGRSMIDLLPELVCRRHAYYLDKALETRELQIYSQTVQIGDRIQEEEVRAIACDDQEEVLFIVRDITERKQAEIALQASEAKSRAILAALPDLMIRANTEGVHLEFVNGKREVCIIPENVEMVGLPMADLIPAEVWERHSYHIHEAIETGELQVYEQTVQLRDRQHHEEVRIIKYTEDEVLFIIRDINDRKEAQRALQESESRFRRLADYAPVLIWMSGVDKQCFYFNQTWLNFTGKTQEQEIVDGWADSVHPEDLQISLEIYNNSFDLRHNFEMEYRLRRHDGEYRWILDCGASRFDGDGNFLGYIGSCIDIDDRKELQKQLLDSEAKLNDILNSVRSGVIRLIVSEDGSWEIDYISNGCEAICGYTVEELTTNKKLWVSRIDPQDWQEIEPQIYEDIFIVREGTHTYRLLHRDGSWRWISQKNTSRWDINLNAWIVSVISADITDRKRIEIELQKSQAALLEAQAIAHIGSWEFDIQSQKITWSPELFCIFGLDPSQTEPSYAEYLQLINTEDSIRLQQCVEQAIAHGTPYQIEYRPILPDGSIRYHEGKARIERDEQGQVKRLFGTALDITDRINAKIALEELNLDLEVRIEQRTAALHSSKEALQISERRFRSFFEFAPIGISVADIQTPQFIAVNSAFCQILGYSEAELLDSYSCKSITLPEDWEMQKTFNESLMGLGKSFYQLEKRCIRKDGEIITVALTATMIRDEDGNISHLLEMVQDITNRKLIEESLRYSEELLRSTIESTPLGMCTLSLEGKFLTVNQFICQIFGYEVKEMLAFTALDLTHPDFLAPTIKNLHRIIAGEISNCGFEKQYLHKSGSIIDAISRVSLVRDKNGNPLQFVVVVENITERKQMEFALQRHMERQQFLMSITQQIRQSLNLNEILNTAVAEVKNLLNGDRATILRLYNDGSTSIVQESVDLAYPSIVNRLWMNESFSDYEVFDYYMTSIPRIINDVYQDNVSSCLAEFMAEAGIKSKIVAPIVQHILLRKEEDREHKWRKGNCVLWGFLIVHACGEYRQWQQEEADLLQQVANQLAIAIQQSDVYERVRNELFTRKQYEQELIRQAAEDRILAEITFAFIQAFTIDTSLNTALEKARQFLNCDRILIYELHADGTGTIFKEAVSRSELSILGETVDDDCFVKTDIGQKYLEGKITALDNIEKLDDTCYINLLRQFNVKANLVLPIVHSQQLWGLFILHQCDRPRSWQSSEIRFAKQIAEQISSAAQKEKLYLQLTSELKQKGTLLKEIHHRVKNNLQIMSSLLRLQFRRTGEEVKAIAEEYQNRIQSMALIHDQLYRSEDLSHIDFHSYLENLAANLFNCFSTNPELIKLNLEVNNIFLPLDQSIPLGLIINELLSNALKYAFPQGHGAINIKLETLGKDMSLVVADNGKGLPLGFDYENTDSLGMQLVLTLTDQLDGKVNYIGDDGAAFHITFPMEEFT